MDESQPDLVILDLVMPKIDGLRVCRHLKTDPRWKDTSVVILSGILVEDIDNLQEIGADAYVAKMPLDKLLPALRNVVRRLEEGCAEILTAGFEGMYRREVVTELMEEKRFRDLLLSSLGEGVAELDRGRTIVWVNPAFAAMVGRDELDLCKEQIEDVLGLDPRSRDAVFLPAGSRDGAESRSHRVAVRGRDLSFKASPVLRGTELLGYMVLLEDVTDALRIAGEREQLRQELAQSEKLLALGELVAGFAHELNNPLAGVLGYAQLILEKSPEEPFRRDLEKILQEAARCRGVVQKLLAFSRATGSAHQPCDLNELIREAVEGHAEMLEADEIDVSLVLASALPRLSCDASQIRRVFTQLIRNARQAMVLGPRPRKLQVTSRCDENRVYVDVADNGIGINESNLPRIFDPFFTTADVGKGSGLGLSVAYGTVRAHGGIIRAASRPGRGASLTVELPTDHDDARADDSQEVAVGRGLPRILVVDDEPVIVELLVDVLESMGARADTARNGVEALRMLAARAYDAVVLDMKMPEMGGREVYETLRQTDPEMLPRILFSTGDLVSAETRQFFDETAAPVLQKPFRINQVTQVLSRVLAIGLPVDQRSREYASNPYSDT